MRGAPAAGPAAGPAASGSGIGRPSETLVRLEQMHEGDLDGFTAPPPSEGSEYSSEGRAAAGDGRNDGDGDDDDDGDDDKGNHLHINNDDDNNCNSEFAQTRYNRAGVPDQRLNLMTLHRLQMQNGNESDENDSSGARAPSDDEFAAAVTSTLYQEPKPIDTASPPHFQLDRSPLLAAAQEAIDDAELDAWLLDGRDSAPALCCAGCCSLFSFLVVLFATITPFWVWNTGSDSYLFGDVTTSTGGYTATSQTLTGSFSQNRSFVRQWTYWTAMPVMEGVCSNETTPIFGPYTSGSMYDDWGGKYGFCSQVDGELSTPSAIIALQVCSTFTVLATLLSSCVSCATPTSGRWAARTAGSFSLVGSALALSSLSIAAAFPWYKDLRAGVGFLPIRYIHDATEVEGVIAIKQPPMSFGPAFYGMVIASFVCLISAGLFFVTLREPAEQDYAVWRSVPALRDTSHHTTDTTAEEDEEVGNESGKVIELTQISTVAQV